MTTHTVSYFRNHALALLDEVAAKGNAILITRRGKPLVHVTPVQQDGGITLGKLRGTMEIKKDIVAPLGDEDWAACR